MSDKIGLFTGSFDPITLGHLDLIERASQLFDHLYVGLFYNPHKSGLFDLEARKRILEELFAGNSQVTVLVSESELVVDMARKNGVTHLVRGLRNATDLEYEASFDFYNRELAPELDTVYLLPKPAYKFVSSSQMRELLHFKQDIKRYVPQAVLNELERQKNENE